MPSETIKQDAVETQNIGALTEGVPFRLLLLLKNEAQNSAPQ